MPLQIIRNDITQVRADAIVNTANPRPVIGRGTDRAIYQAAGPELLRARRRIGELRPGQAAQTPAFRLPAKYVLHTVSPAWVDGAHGEEALLRKSYDAALELSERLGCASVAFPLMAAGTHGFPRDLALSVAIAAFTDFLLEHDMTIFLVLFNGNAFRLASSLFADLKSYIDDNYVAEKRREEYRPQERRPEAMKPSSPRPSPPKLSAPRPSSSRPNLRFPASDVPPPPESRAFSVTAKPTEEFTLDGAVYESVTLGDTHDSAAMPPAAVASDAADAADLAALLGQSDSTFSEFLLDLLRERSGRDSEVYKRAEISKQLFSKILSNRDYRPTKNTAIQLAIGLQLDVAQTQKLLGKAGFVLTRSSKADLVVQYYIERRVYSVTFINEALSDCGLPLLKTGLKA